ncbi:hypothetical protein LCGC14_1547360 [marine sediment metagenome]|uniref:Uncharacterized protein n=2 Tax=root TaxID=1 RepID=A0A831VPY1_9FLAO|nr:hypothetical protein [Pricia sp.]HEA23325.1 hypothetical protein [Pricia antarctica]
MNSESSSSIPKKVYITSVPHTEQLAIALEILKKYPDLNLTPTIVLNLNANRSDTPRDSKNFEKQAIEYWKRFWKVLPPSAIFEHELIGTFLVMGALAPIFNTKIDGRPLAKMANGPRNILRGLGIGEVQTTKYVNSLAEGRHMLIVRVFQNKLKLLEKALEVLKR